MKNNLNKTNYLPIIYVIICLLIFWWIAFEVNTGNLKSFDESILYSLREQNNLNDPVGKSWLLPFMKNITMLGNVVPIIIVTSFMVILLAVKHETQFLWLILFVVIGGALIDFLLKDIFARNRPEIVPHLVAAYSYSFPSGHSVISAVVYPAFAVVILRITGNKKIKLYIVSLVIILVLLIGFSRVYLGVHYPTDVLAGWIIGTAWSLLCWIISGLNKTKIIQQGS